MSIRIDIDDLPGSVNKFTMQQLASAFLKLNRHNQILTIQIKESHLPTDCARIMTWNFWNAYGNVAGVSDVKRSTIKMILYSRTHKASKNGQGARESAQRIKNASLIKRAEQDLADLNSRLQEALQEAGGNDDEVDTTTLKSQILIKEKIISTLRGEEENSQSGTSLDPAQIGAIGKRVFDILKAGDNGTDAKILKSEFEFISTGVRPGHKDKHRFQEGGRTRIYKSDGSWRTRGKSGSGSRGGKKSRSPPQHRAERRVSSKSSKSSKNSKSAKPKPGSYVPPHLRKGADKINATEKSKEVKYVPPHLRTGAKTFRESKHDDNDENSENTKQTAKYVPPSMRKSDSRDRNSNRNNGLGRNEDKYISLDTIEKDAPSFNPNSEFDFPELGSGIKKVESVKTESKSNVKTVKTVKIDTSNVFSKLADMDWDADPDIDEESEDDAPAPSAWGSSAPGGTFADIVKREPKKNETTRKASLTNSESKDETFNEWGDWSAPSTRLNIKLSGAPESKSNPRQRSIVSANLTNLRSELNDSNENSSPPMITPMGRIKPRLTNWNNDWDNEDDSGDQREWTVEHTWDRDNSANRNTWAPTIKTTTDKSYDAFFEDEDDEDYDEYW